MPSLRESLAKYPESLYDIPLQQAVEDFPAAAEWLGEHHSAQISHKTGLRLASADETFAIENVQDRLVDKLNATRGDRKKREFAILSACSNQPTSFGEIFEYVELTGLEDPRVLVHASLTTLHSRGELTTAERVVYLHKIPLAPSSVVLKPSVRSFHISTSGRGKLIRSEQPARRFSIHFARPQWATQ